MTTPWIRFFPSDWLGGTRTLKPVESGIYMTLIMLMYESETPLQENYDRLALVCNTSVSVFKKVLNVLITENKIICTHDGLWNEKVEKEIKNSREKSESARQRISKRWEKKDNKNNDSGDTVVSEQHIASNTNHNHNHNHSIKNISSNEDIQKKPRKKNPKRISEPDLNEKFDSLKAIFPHRSGGNDWPRAKKNLGTALRRGEDFLQILQGIQRYAEFCETKGQTGTEFVQKAANWISNEGWKNDYSDPDQRAPPAKNEKSRNVFFDYLMKTHEEQHHDKQEFDDTNNDIFTGSNTDEHGLFDRAKTLTIDG